MRISELAEALARHADRAILDRLHEAYRRGDDIAVLADRAVESPRRASPDFAFAVRHVADWCLIDAAFQAAQPNPFEGAPFAGDAEV